MSYDIEVLASPLSDHDAEAWEEFETIMGEIETQIGKKSKIPAVFRTLHARLTSRFPCLSSLSDEKADESVWSSGPLLNNFGSRVAQLNLIHSRVKETLPFVVEVSTSLGLTVFDSTTNLIHRPNGLNGMTLNVEDRHALQSPTLVQIRDAVDAMTPDGGPGFLVLEDATDYAQAAGGNGKYTAEWRKHSSQKFTHWVVGLPEKPSTKNVLIKTNGFKVSVKENERLTAEDVKLVLSAFGERKRRPSKFVWRDVTDRFE